MRSIFAIAPVICAAILNSTCAHAAFHDANKPHLLVLMSGYLNSNGVGGATTIVGKYDTEDTCRHVAEAVISPQPPTPPATYPIHNAQSTYWPIAFLCVEAPP